MFHRKSLWTNYVIILTILEILTICLKNYYRHDDYEPPSSQQKKFKANPEEENASTKYNAEGLTRSFHGNVYQLKLLMLFLWRGVCKKYNFDLATEMVEAEKFDDIVFAYKDEKTGEKVYRFLQAKHKQDEKKTITANDLLTENDDEFSLQKYFISFRKIKQNIKFKGYKLKDFIICTNIDLHEDLKNSFIPIVDELGDAEANNSDEPHTINISNTREDILSFAFTEKECKRLKLNLSSFPQKDRLLMTLCKTTDCFRLAKKLATCVKEGKKLDLRGDHDLFKVYHVALGENVIERERNKNGKEVDSCVFKSSFLNADSSVPDLDGFKKVFHQAYQEVTKEKLSSHAFLERLKKQKMPLSSTFGKSKDSKLKTSLPNDQVVTDSEINSFLDKLVFAVNQPNETELGKIIKNEMGQYKDINLIDCEFMVSKLQKEILDWMKQKEGSLFTYQQGKNLFEEIKQNISKLVLIGPTIEYCDKIEAFGIEFCKPVQELETFLDSKTEQVFCLISQNNNMMLSSMKVYQALKKNCKYEKDDSYIFMRLSSLLNKGMQNHFTSVSQSAESNVLLVIECEVPKEAMHEAFNKLCNIIKLSVEKKKKVILISEDNKGMLDRLKTIFHSENGLIKEKKDEACTLVDLTEDSQNQVLKNSQVTFQGVNLNLNKLINCENKCLLEKINGELILKLINNEKVCIGKAAKDWKYDMVEPYCMDRTLIRHIIKIKKHIEKQNHLFFVTENEKNLEDISQSNLDIVIISDTVEAFQNICEKYKGCNIHWLKRTEKEFEWKKTQGNLSKLRDFVVGSTHSTVGKNDNNLPHETFYSPKLKIVNFEPAIEEIVPKKITDVDGKVVLIAAEPGMGKSIILSHLAVHTQSAPFPIWIVRGNLSDYVRKFSRWEKYGTEVSVKEAVIFLCDVLQFQLFKNFNRQETEKKESIMNEMLTIVNNQLIFNFLSSNQNDEVVLKTNEKKRIRGSSLLHVNETSIFEMIMFIHFYNQGRIAVLLDGFDEISPTYKNKGMELLLLALKLTNVDKIWVTTRPYNIKNDIENNLGTFSYSLKSFFREEQVRFLKKFWEKKLNLSELDEQRANIFIDDLLNRFSALAYQTNKNFVGIPLQIYMIAEVFTNSFEKFHGSNASDVDELDNLAPGETLDLIYLYETFLQTKFEVAYPELVCKKWSVPTINDSNDGEVNLYQKHLKIFIENHKILAARTLIGGLLSKQEMDMTQKFIPMIEEGKEKTGIINKIVNDKPDFVHRTFAEYLSANYLWQKFNTIEIGVFQNDFARRIVIRFLIEDEMVQISRFFQLIAVKYLDSKANISDVIDKLTTLTASLIGEVQKYDLIPTQPGRLRVGHSTRISTRQMFEILEFSSSLKGSVLELIINGIQKCEEQYRLLCLCAEFGYIKLAKILAEKLETKFLEHCLHNGYWENSPLWLAAENHHLDDILILVEKYSKFFKPLMDVEGRTLTYWTLEKYIHNRYDISDDLVEYLKHNFEHKDENRILVFTYCLKYNLIDAKPYFGNGKLRLPILEVLAHENVPSFTVEQLIEKSDFDVVNNFQYCHGTKNMCFASLNLVWEYDEKLTENAVKNGMDFSRAIYLLLYKYTKYNVGLCSSKHSNSMNKNKVYLYNVNRIFEKEFSYIYKKIVSLLKCGVGYNYKDDKYKLTTLQLVKQICNIHTLLIAVYELCKFENENPMVVLLSLIIESIAKTPNFKGYKIIIESTQISLLPIYFNDPFSSISPNSLEYSKKIQLSPNYMSELLYELYTKNNAEIIQNELAELCPPAEYYKKQSNFRKFHFQELKLMPRLKLLIEEHSYTSNDAIVEIKAEVLKIEKLLIQQPPVNESSTNEEKMYNMNEILSMLEITSTYANKFQKFTSTFFDRGSIQIRLLIKIWLEMKKTLGVKKIMGFLEERATFSWRSSEILSLFNELDDSYNALVCAIENQKHQDINEILQQNPDFIKSIINSQDDKFGSPLHYAIHKSDKKTIDHLLTNGVNPNLRLNNDPLLLGNGNYENWAPLHIAALNDQSEIAKMLITAGSKIDAIIYATTIYNGESALHASARSSANHSKTAQLLLQRGATYNFKNARDQTPLDLATDGSDIKELLNWIDQMFENVENNKKDIVDSLLNENNEKIDTILYVKNSSALTLLQLAAANKYTDIVRIITEKLKSNDPNHQLQETVLADAMSFHKTLCICKEMKISDEWDATKIICTAFSHSLFTPLNYKQMRTASEHLLTFCKLSSKNENHQTNCDIKQLTEMLENI